MPITICFVIPQTILTTTTETVAATSKAKLQQQLLQPLLQLLELQLTASD